MKILKKTVLYFSENAFQKNMIFVRFSPTIAQKKFDTKMVKKNHRAPRNRGGRIRVTAKCSILGKNENQSEPWAF